MPPASAPSTAAKPASMERVWRGGGLRGERMRNEVRAATKAQAAVTAYAAEHDLNRFEVENQLRQVTRHPPKPEE